VSAEQISALAVAIRESALAVLRQRYPRGDDEDLKSLAQEIGNNAAQAALFALEEI